MKKSRIALCGDICSNQGLPTLDTQFREHLSAVDIKVANLEGAIFQNHPSDDGKGIWSSPEILTFLQQLDIRHVCLANNHIFDFSAGFAETAKLLEKSGIIYFGAGASLEVAEMCHSVSNEPQSPVLSGFGWDAIGCKRASKGQNGVNPFRPKAMLNTAQEFRKRNQDSPLIFVVHWNYELEKWPQPAHRQLAFDLIDSGVDAVIGMHSHIPQGAELYKGKLIAYGLGNFWMPPRQVGNLWMDHGAASCRGLTVDLSFDNRNLEQIQWYWSQADFAANRLALYKVENGLSDEIQTLTPFSGLSHSDYYKWFKKHRTRKKMLPVYRNYRRSWTNFLFTQWLKLRHRLITFLVHSGLKKSLS